MVMNLNLELFCENLKATKPPYECPIDGCGKIYKSYAGIQFHLYHYDHDNPDGGLSPNSMPPSSPGRHLGALQHRQGGTSASSVHHDALDGDNSLWVEVDLSGCTYKINIHEPLVLINDETTETFEKDSMEKNRLVPKDISGLHKVDSNGAVSPSIKLPEAHFKVLDDYIQPSEVPPKPSNYYRFIEKTQEEIEDEVEYDLDEEDFVWLELMNERRKKENLPSVSKDILELLMDRFEKHCYFEVKSSRRLPRDEDAICSVCLDGECHINNVILFCDLCNLAVHQECYGVPHIPEGSWICRRCLLSPSKPVECCLCPNKRGAFKQTEDGRWAHVICALWIPEVGFANGVFLEPIDGIERIAAARWKLACYICKQRGTGACIQCHKTSCYTAFHVTCAQQAGLYMKTEPMRDTGVNGTTLSVRKTAFCDIHSPQTESSALMVVSSSEDDIESSCSAMLPAEARAKSRLRLRKARKALSESRNSSPVLAIPVISPSSIKEITDKVSFRSKEEFIRRLCSYWSLKRQSKNGVPLLRTSMSSIHILRNREAHQPLHSPVSSSSSGNTSKVNNAESSDLRLEEQFKYCKKLRQQLEKVRLLNELVRKREKLKQEHLRLHEKVLQLQLSPLNTLLSHILEQLQERNSDSSFTKPSSTGLLESDASSSTTIDFSKMQSKLNHHGYTTVDEMAVDFNTLLSGCMNLHSSDEQRLKAYTRLQDQGAVIFKTASEVACKVGFDTKTGLHLLSSNSSNPATNQPGPSTDEKPSCKDKLQAPGSRVEATETKARLSPISSHESTKSETLNNQETTTTPSGGGLLTVSRPTGINRRSAVLHSKKARQSAMRLLGTAKAIFENGEGNSMSSDGNTVKSSPDPTDAEKEFIKSKDQSVCPSDEKVIKNEADSLNVVEVSSKATGESESPLVEVRQGFCSGGDSAHVSKNKTELGQCHFPESGSDASDKVKTETRDKSTGRKRLRSASETRCPTSEKKPTRQSNFNESQNEDANENHRQYATRGNKSHSQLPSKENEEIIIPLEPLALVWAKCSGFPWYPALVIDPKMVKNAAFHNTVPLPIPPPEVLSLRKKYSQPVFLVSFFDARRTWQWLPREKLDPLGVDSGLDNAKLLDNKKPNMRQAVKMAYQKAVRHRCMVTGEPLPQPNAD